MAARVVPTVNDERRVDASQWREPKASPVEQSSVPHAGEYSSEEVLAQLSNLEVLGQKSESNARAEAARLADVFSHELRADTCAYKSAAGKGDLAREFALGVEMRVTRNAYERALAIRERYRQAPTAVRPPAPITPATELSPAVIDTTPERPAPAAGPPKATPSQPITAYTRPAVLSDSRAAAGVERADQGGEKYSTTVFDRVDVAYDAKAAAVTLDGFLRDVETRRRMVTEIRSAVSGLAAGTDVIDRLGEGGQSPQDRAIRRAIATALYDEGLSMPTDYERRLLPNRPPWAQSSRSNGWPPHISIGIGIGGRWRAGGKPSPDHGHPGDRDGAPTRDRRPGTNDRIPGRNEVPARNGSTDRLRRSAPHRRSANRDPGSSSPGGSFGLGLRLGSWLGFQSPMGNRGQLRNHPRSFGVHVHGGDVRLFGDVRSPHEMGGIVSRALRGISHRSLRNDLY